MLATVSQHHRQKNAEQTHNRRRARMLGCYWVHFKPRGYKYIDGEGGGRVLVRDEPLASIIAEGLEGYASKRFVLKAEVMRFWQGYSEFPKNGKGLIPNEEVNRILKRVVYAGYIQSDIMEISLRRAKHEPLISLETWQKIQDRMQVKAYVPARKNLDEDFPLRGSCRCAECENPLTACWSKGRTKYYPYYYCFTKGCEVYGKSIRRDLIEGQLETMLKELQPSKAIFKTISNMAEKWWGYRQEQAHYHLNSTKKDQVKLDKQMEQVMDRLIDADSPSLIAAYEARIKKLEINKMVLTDKSQNTLSFDAALRTALEFVSNPYKIWATGLLANRQTVLKLTQPSGLFYCHKKGLRTAEIPLIFKVLDASKITQMQMAEREGFEPSMSF